MKKQMKNLIIALIVIFILVACDSRIRKINIYGTYRSNKMMGYEAKVENGTITIYSIGPFDKNVYWYGTCKANELDENNKLISKRIETQRERNWFFSDFGFGLNRSGVKEKEILFTNNSLIFIYDMNGMAVSQEILYKESETERKKGSYDSNAEKENPNYIEPSKPLPHEIPRGETVPAPTETPKDPPINSVPNGDNYSL